MPDKPVTVAAYAAGASLAAITFFYVFGPTFFIDGENSCNTSSGRKRGIIGLSNPANDCFINSVLQALAGLGELRLYLIRELHRRKLDGPEIYETVPRKEDLEANDRLDKIQDLQKGPVAKALKEMLDALNERPIYKKTISARPLIEALERAFRTRISRSQQDAQEFFQVVVERLCDEHHAAVRARKHASSLNRTSIGPSVIQQDLSLEENDMGKAEAPQVHINVDGAPVSGATNAGYNAILEKDDGFPFEGKLESQIRCQFCGFKYKPSWSTFVSLTLNVPQKNATTLDNCFDILLKTEDIGDFRCDKCRLDHALGWKENKLGRARTTEEREALWDDIELIKKALKDDPEQAPKGVELPGQDQAPRRDIKKYMRITVFPKIIAIHLSRSVFDPQSYSTKNSAKVSFPERLRLGGLLEEKQYKLLGVVCHKGSHSSGHYESFRRNHLYPPFATPDVFRAYATHSRNASVTPSPDPSPRIPAMTNPGHGVSRLSMISTPSISSASQSPPGSRPSSGSTLARNHESTGSSLLSSDIKLPFRPQSQQRGTAPGKSLDNSGMGHNMSSKFQRKKKTNERWWRISDDKIKECKTGDVLAMQREVYLLFYELERAGDDAVS